MSPKNERFEMRVDEAILARVDQWRSHQSGVPSRAEAMRRLVELGLENSRTDSTQESIRLSDGEKLMLIMLGELSGHLKVESDTSNFVNEMIYGGHYWAAPWALPGIFHGHEDRPEHLHIVLDILEMWDHMERAYERLSTKEKEYVTDHAAPIGNRLEFPGFDGNHESKYLHIASFLVNKMERFTRFAGRDLNAHMPTIDSHQRMLDVFASMRPTLIRGDLSAAQLVTLLRAKPHPESKAAQEMRASEIRQP